MFKIFHAADSRGVAEHGWLHSHHSFSFADYHNPERMGFGKLRVLNDDIVEPGAGFGTHPHRNMEIISIPLSGALRHRDSMGHESVIRTGDVQVMSAGSGLLHSEFNDSNSEQVNFLQIWIFTDKLNVEPRYDQKSFARDQRQGQLQLVVSPDARDDSLWIHQNAFMSLGEFQQGQICNYTLSDTEHGVYIFVIEGEVELEGQHLQRRDALGVAGAESIAIKTLSAAKLLLIEVPA